MPSCPNCGQETSGASCLWCGYPIMETKPATPEGDDKERGETKEQTKMETEDANQAKKAAAKTARDTSAELFKGEVKLTVVPPVDLSQVRKLEEHLSQVNDLSLVLIGGSAVEGTEIIVSAENPLPLLDILEESPPVAEVTKKGKNIHITLKTE